MSIKPDRLHTLFKAFNYHRSHGIGFFTSVTKGGNTTILSNQYELAKLWQLLNLTNVSSIKLQLFLLDLDSYKRKV